MWTLVGSYLAVVDVPKSLHLDWTGLEFLSRMHVRIQDWSLCLEWVLMGGKDWSSCLEWLAKTGVRQDWGARLGLKYFPGILGQARPMSVIICGSAFIIYCPVIHNARKLWNVFLSITRLVDFLYSFTRDVEFLYSITIASEFFYSITVSVEFLYSITRHVQFLLSFARVASCGLNCLYFIRMSCGIPLFTRIPALSLLYSQKMWIWWFTDFVDCQNRLCGLSKLNSPYYPNGKDWLAQADTPLPAETGD